MNKQEFNFDATPESTITKVNTPIVVELLKPHLSSNKKLQAQVRMTVKTTYPEAGVGNSLNDSIFGAEAFGFGDGQTYDEKRVGWIDVPANSTVEEVQAQMNKFPKARLYKTLSLEPVLTDQQVRAMLNGISKYTAEDGSERPIDFNYYKSRQAVINPETGEYIKYKGHLQYRVVSFSVNGKEDIDLRPEQYAAMNATANNVAFQMNAPIEALKVGANQF